jgi:hypothetical protein
MKLVQLTGAKGVSVWISAGQITYLSAPESAENSLYGSTNAKGGARVMFAGGTHVDVRESADEIASRLSD